MAAPVCGVRASRGPSGEPGCAKRGHDAERGRHGPATTCAPQRDSSHRHGLGRNLSGRAHSFGPLAARHKAARSQVEQLTITFGRRQGAKRRLVPSATWRASASARTRRTPSNWPTRTQLSDACCPHGGQHQENPATPDIEVGDEHEVRVALAVLGVGDRTWSNAIQCWPTVPSSGPAYDYLFEESANTIIVFAQSDPVL